MISILAALHSKSMDCQWQVCGNWDQATVFITVTFQSGSGISPTLKSSMLVVMYVCSKRGTNFIP